MLYIFKNRNDICLCDRAAFLLGIMIFLSNLGWYLFDVQFCVYMNVTVTAISKYIIHHLNQRKITMGIVFLVPITHCKNFSFDFFSHCNHLHQYRRQLKFFQYILKRGIQRSGSKYVIKKLIVSSNVSMSPMAVRVCPKYCANS